MKISLLLVVLAFLLGLVNAQWPGELNGQQAGIMVAAAGFLGWRLIKDPRLVGVHTKHEVLLGDDELDPSHYTNNDHFGSLPPPLEISNTDLSSGVSPLLIETSSNLTSTFTSTISDVSLKPDINLELGSLQCSVPPTPWLDKLQETANYIRKLLLVTIQSLITLPWLDKSVEMANYSSRILLATFQPLISLIGCVKAIMISGIESEHFETVLIRTLQLLTAYCFYELVKLKGPPVGAFYATKARPRILACRLRFVQGCHDFGTLASGFGGWSKERSIMVLAWAFDMSKAGFDGTVAFIIYLIAAISEINAALVTASCDNIKTWTTGMTGIYVANLTAFLILPFDLMARIPKVVMIRIAEGRLQWRLKNHRFEMHVKYNDPEKVLKRIGKSMIRNFIDHGIQVEDNCRDKVTIFGKELAITKKDVRALQAGSSNGQVEASDDTQVQASSNGKVRVTGPPADFEVAFRGNLRRLGGDFKSLAKEVKDLQDSNSQPSRFQSRNHVDTTEVTKLRKEVKEMKAEHKAERIADHNEILDLKTQLSQQQSQSQRQQLALPPPSPPEVPVVTEPIPPPPPSTSIDEPAPILVETVLTAPPSDSYAPSAAVESAEVQLQPSSKPSPSLAAAVEDAAITPATSSPISPPTAIVEDTVPPPAPPSASPTPTPSTPTLFNFSTTAPGPTTFTASVATSASAVRRAPRSSALRGSRPANRTNLHNSRVSFNPHVTVSSSSQSQGAEKPLLMHLDEPQSNVLTPQEPPVPSAPIEASAVENPQEPPAVPPAVETPPSHSQQVEALAIVSQTPVQPVEVPQQPSNDVAAFSPLVQSPTIHSVVSEPDAMIVEQSQSQQALTQSTAVEIIQTQDEDVDMEEAIAPSAEIFFRANKCRRAYNRFQ